MRRFCYFFKTFNAPCLPANAGRCSNTAEVRLLRTFWEAPDVKRGGEMTSVNILFMQIFLLRFDYRTKLIHYFSDRQLHLETFFEDWEPTKLILGGKSSWYEFVKDSID
ncbi:hypothetical protein N665_4555s0002 [Sinapis alba]|nr:hypothetical protein N665_4555s0002 [Sinapis alba]KAF8045674.1 hypothetical protein N665_4555s0002 [Sinapis alba]KAF8045675.1 hypothetical protein N665_4555s0002 [Sinapis alba]KAF8045676.1 hypothetical protein N665_4555s0002 [Sinapis alba]